MSNELDSILNGETAETPAAPVAGRTRTAVASGGSSSILMQVNDSFEAVFNGFSEVSGNYGTSKLYKFTLITPANLTVVTKDPDTKVKTEERKAVEAGSTVSLFAKGNLGFLLGSIVEGQDVELKRSEDGVLPKTHKYSGTKVHTYELFA